MSYWLSIRTAQEVPRRERLDRVADFDTELAAAADVARRWPEFDCAPYIDETGAPVLLVWATRTLAQAGVTPTAVVDTDMPGFRVGTWTAARATRPTLALVPAEEALAVSSVTEAEAYAVLKRLATLPGVNGVVIFVDTVERGPQLLTGTEEDGCASKLATDVAASVRALVSDRMGMPPNATVVLGTKVPT